MRVFINNRNKKQSLETKNQVWTSIFNREICYQIYRVFLWQWRDHLVNLRQLWVFKTRKGTILNPEVGISYNKAWLYHKYLRGYLEVNYPVVNHCLMHQMALVINLQAKIKALLKWFMKLLIVRQHWKARVWHRIFYSKYNLNKLADLLIRLTKVILFNYLRSMER